jgi:hypothetical protein
VSGAQLDHAESAAASPLTFADDRAAKTGVTDVLSSSAPVIVSDEGRKWEEIGTAAPAAAAMRMGTASFIDACIVASMCWLCDKHYAEPIS